MRLWVDVVNAPHVRLFARVIRLHRNEMEDLLITSREYGYLRDLIKALIPEKTVFIGQRRASLPGKLLEYCRRTKKLAGVVSKFNPDASASKASPELARVSFGLGIPSVNLNDNDLSIHVSKLVFPLSDVVVVPEVFPKEALEAAGAVCRVRRFRGVTEVAHVLGYTQQEGRKGTEVKVKAPYVVVRPEPSKASYLEGERAVESLLVGAASELAEMVPDLSVVIFPRDNHGMEAWGILGDRIVLQRRATDTMPLLDGAAAFIGAGGTMTREAALLGTPTVSVFPGREPAPTRLLIEEGLVKRSSKPAEIADFIMHHLEDQEKREELKSTAERFVKSCEDPAEVMWEEILGLVP